ncbi:TVP38/TMEM64 family protein [Pedosphaera parvula]|uniref:TVP38/TMEM64 family membrane protein n=1 Tax=Pedosphaera parvula (strain Ellin514) TaxID=320771 RepID=B9XJU7_PEDPL|nr:TVP38/TMEM64 family protein [Pedosphaera parvula]EEF59973.1 SNARE associated Golgi protein [Pedosphaera parvula Ellin514]
MNGASATGSKSSSKWKWVLWIVVILLLIGLGKYLHVQTFLQKLLDWINGLGAWGWAAFVLIYILACVLLIPGSILTLGAGAIFGVVKGSILVSIGATLGATVAFLIGRYLARNAIARKIEHNEKFSAIDKAVAAQGWKIVLLTRLSPIFPFTLLNYVFGLTRISLRDYVLASWIGMMPGTVMYVYIGSLARLAGERTRTPAEWALYGIGLIATVVVTIFVTRIARNALNEQIANN